MDFLWQNVHVATLPSYIGFTRAICATDSIQFFLVSSSVPSQNALYSSRNKGVTWVKTSENKSGVGVWKSVVAKPDASLLFVFNPTAKTLLRSSWQGSSFSDDVKIDNPEPLVDMFVSNNLQRVLINSNSFVSHSVNSGASFSRVQSQVKAAVLSDVSDEVLYIKDSQPYRTTDFFSTNESLNVGAGQVFLPLLAASNDLKFAVGVSFFENSYRVWSLKQNIVMRQMSLVPINVRVFGTMVVLIMPNEILLSQNQTSFVPWQTNPPASVVGLGNFTDVSFANDAWVANTSSAVFRSCSSAECLTLPAVCPASDLRRAIVSGCGVAPSCKNPGDKIHVGADGKPVQGQRNGAGATADAVRPWWRPWDICPDSFIRCTPSTGIEVKGCSAPQVDYHYKVCEQPAPLDDNNKQLQMACDLGMEFPEKSDLRHCCTQSRCQQTKVRPAGDFVRQCLEFKDVKPACKGWGVDMQSTQTIGEGCSKPIQDFCTANDYKNMSTPECFNWCNVVQGDSKIGTWCDDAAREYCNRHGRGANGQIIDPRCGCLLSPFLQATCLDPDCTNPNAYRTNIQREERTKTSCPQMCLQFINVNSTRRNVNVDNNQFQIQCNQHLSEDKKNIPLSKWYVCDETTNQCRLARTANPPENGEQGQYKDDPSCGGQCERVEPDVFYRCETNGCAQTPNSVGAFKNDPTCGGACGASNPNNNMGWIIGGSVGAVVVVVLVVVLAVVFSRKR